LKKTGFILILLSVVIACHAQKNNDDKLAMQFYDHKEYDKALVYFDKLYDKIPDAYYTYYYKCLIETKDYVKAEKITKKQIKRSDGNVYLYVRLGNVYKLQGNLDKEKDQYNKAIKEVVAEQNNIFTRRQEF
jgi:tetratricopeptide (TPR) repeat protein